MSCGYIINGRMNNNRRQLLQRELSVARAGRATSGEGRRYNILLPLEAVLWPHQTYLNILYTQEKET